MAYQTLLPCVELPDPELISIPLPFGTVLKSVVDSAKGPPTDCTLAQSLMIQLSPMLASMECLFRILKALNAILEVAKGITPLNAIEKLGDVITALEDLSQCFLMLSFPSLCPMIKGILATTLAYLNCLIEAFDSLWQFQLGIDLNAAQGNPVLLNTLLCAQENAQRSFHSTMQAMEAVEPLIQMVNNLLGVVGQEPIKLPPTSGATPSLADIAEGEDPIAPIRTVRDTIQTIHDALPC